MDLIRTRVSGLTSHQLVKIGQVTTLLLVILAAAWAPQIEKFQSLWTYLQSVLAYLSPPIAAAFIVGLFYRGATASGAFYSLVLGYAVSMLFLVMKLNGWAPAVTGIHFLLQVPILLLICILLNITISHFDSVKPDAEVIAQYTWRKEIFQAETIELRALLWYQNYRYLSVFLLLATAAIVGTFW